MQKDTQERIATGIEIQDVGGGFIPIDDLTSIVDAWQLRNELCEDVDLLEQKGGNSGHKNRHELHLQRAQDRPIKRNSLFFSCRKDRNLQHKLDHSSAFD